METILKCPVCNKPLVKKNRSFVCDNFHTFDIAKQGYVNLLQSQSGKVKTHGDSQEMLQARKNILYKGYYKDISKKISTVISKLKNDTVIDIGSGIGYYCDILKQDNPNINLHGIDISKDGIKEASKNNKEIQYTVGTNNKLPYISDKADIILSVFSPINIDECLRVLKPGGTLITVSPNTNHLMELKELVYKEIIEKDYQVNELIHQSLEKVSKIDVINNITIKDNDLYDLFMMTPHFFKTSRESKEHIKDIKNFDVTIDVVISIYKYN